MSIERFIEFPVGRASRPAGAVACALLSLSLLLLP